MPTSENPVVVIEGDCLSVLPELEPGSVQAVVTDPPYGIALGDHSQGGRHGRRRPAWEESIAGDESQELGQWVIDWCGRVGFPVAAFASPKLPWLGKWSSLLVWDKGGAVGGGGDVKRCWKQTWELIQIGRFPEVHGPRDCAVLRFPMMPDDSADHPAAKSLDLVRYLVRKLTRPGDLILDPFAGSGTTGVAAIAEGRRAILIEREPKYAEIARKRIAEALGLGAGSLLAGLPPARGLFDDAE